MTKRTAVALCIITATLLTLAGVGSANIHGPIVPEKAFTYKKAK